MDLRVKTEVVARLTGVRALLANAAAWCQNANARTASGISTGVRHGDACQWCLNGALLKVSYERDGDDMDYGWRKSRDLLHSCCHEITDGCGYITDTNDRADMTHETILKIIDCSLVKANALDVEA